MPISATDRDILRRLAAQLRQIADLPRQQETIRLWKALNSLRPHRPMFTIDQIPWHEMDVDGELACQAQDPWCREVETDIRRLLYRWKHMPADMAIEPEIYISKTIRNSGYGYERKEETAALDPHNDVVGHYYLDQIKTDADIDKIHTPLVSLDRETTARHEEQAHAIFDGILKVHMLGAFPWCGPWDVITQWRGVEATLYDLTDRPEFMHRLVSRLTDSFLGLLDSLEAQDLLADHMQYVHCTGAWTDELPKPGFNPARPRTCDLWTFGMAQIFGSVSPAMHEEFEVPCMQRIYARFGLGYYGCCEPLDDRIHLVRQIPNVRKVSMSPWTNQERGARAIGRDFVFSRKPSPALLAVDTFNPAAVKADLQQTINICHEHGCPLELILKDISTVRYEPQRLWQWAEIARDLVHQATPNSGSGTPVWL